MSDVHPGDLMSPQAAAEYLGVKASTIRGWACSGRLTKYKIGNLLRFRKEDLDGLVQKVPAIGAEA